MILDDRIVREYNLAVEHLSHKSEKDPRASTPRSQSSNSVSSIATLDSVLSKDFSVMDLIQDQLDEEEELEVIYVCKEEGLQPDTLWSFWDTEDVALSRTPLDFSC